MTKIEIDKSLHSVMSGNISIKTNVIKKYHIVLWIN